MDLTPAKTYEQMHSGLHWAFGRAKDYVCIECGQQAEDWAYQYTSIDPQIDTKNRVYSESFDDYAPMCRSCHRRFDMLRPERREAQLAHLARVHAAIAADPVAQERRREAGVKGRQVIAEMRAQGVPMARGRRTDTANLRVLGKMVGSIRRRCNTCGLETAAGPLARHQTKSGHTGWTVA
jgi:hypothetical protein